jgi:hypothetical protein
VIVERRHRLAGLYGCVRAAVSARPRRATGFRTQTT